MGAKTIIEMDGKKTRIYNLKVRRMTRIRTKLLERFIKINIQLDNVNDFIVIQYLLFITVFTELYVDWGRRKKTRSERFLV